MRRMKKNSIRTALLLCLGAAPFVSAGEKTVLKSDFAADRTFGAWYDIGNAYVKAVPQAKPVKALTAATAEEEGGEVFMRIPAGPFGVSCRLTEPIAVDDTLKSITVELKIRQDRKRDSSILEISLTSRDQLSCDCGGPFWKGRDSGFSARGYRYSIQNANLLYWRRDGQDFRKYKSAEPYNLFPAAVLKDWVPLKLEYDHKTKVLRFTCGELDPFEMRNVELDGRELRSLYIRSGACDVKDILVTVITE